MGSDKIEKMHTERYHEHIDKHNDGKKHYVTIVIREKQIFEIASTVLIKSRHFINKKANEYFTF